MTTIARHDVGTRAGHAGLRLTVEAYFALPADGNRYELIDGVVVISPSPAPLHQRVALVILRQLVNHVQDHALGEVFYETDVSFARAGNRAELVYRPDIAYFAVERARAIVDRIEIIPDLIVEVVSPDSRGRDLVTKREDYERAGVREYWLIDPLDSGLTFFRLVAGKYAEVACSASHYASEAVPGFQLDLVRVRAAFKAVGG